MKILLISDTHGHISKISEYAGRIKPDFCIHAGDFGFYDENSVKALTQREAYLQVKHSGLPEAEKAELLKWDASIWKRTISEKGLLGNFADYIHGKNRFGEQIYAVWGNHDDSKVVLQLLKSPVDNLHILHDKDIADCGDFCLLGLGGNCTPAKAFCQKHAGIPGAQCRPSSVLQQYLSLLQTAQTVSDKPKVLVTHVSPLVEPFLELVAWQIGAVLTVSGHMGYPDGQTGKTGVRNWHRLNETYQQLCKLYPEDKARLEMFCPQKKELRIQHINLPDADVGYAVLDWNGCNFSYEIRGKKYLDKIFWKETAGLRKLCKGIIDICEQEYKLLLPLADEIMSGNITDEKEIEYIYDRMLDGALHSKNTADLFLRCCQYTENTMPELTKDYLEMYHTMYDDEDGCDEQEKY